jgi:hypothetical protein
MIVKNIDKGMIDMLTEETKSKLDQLLSECMVDDNQLLIEEHESYIRDNIEEIIECNDGQLPDKFLFVDMTSYENIDEEHYLLNGKIHKRYGVGVNETSIKKDFFEYLPEEIVNWYKSGHNTSSMPLKMFEEFMTINNCYDRNLTHEELLEDIKQQKSLSRDV